jgi:hypothetical protein
MPRHCWAIVVVVGELGCAPTQTPAHVQGACDLGCPSGEACVDGACAFVCAAGLAQCGTAGDGGSCVDLSRDPFNCGSCGQACAAGEVCASGVCAAASGSCPANEQLCSLDAGAYCADLGSDAYNCGGCGAVCPSGDSCQMGSCVAFCPQGFAACASAVNGCSDLQLDPANCGVCGHVCAPASICSDGVCVCGPGLTNCGSPSALSCIDLQGDATNCGACGHTCLACEACAAGACVSQLAFQWQPLMRLDGGVSVTGFAVGDLDGDGSDDLAVLVLLNEYINNSQAYAASLQILFNDGGGGFPSRKILAATDAGEVWGPLAVADLNGDGRPDLVWGTHSNEYVGVLGVRIAYAEAGGGFELSPELSVIPDALYYDSWAGLIVEDLNGDGRPDIALLEGLGYYSFVSVPPLVTSILYSLPDGGFLAATVAGPVIADAGVYSGGLIGGDLNGDGLDDLLIVCWVDEFPSGGGYGSYEFIRTLLQSPDGGLELAGDYTPMGDIPSDFSLSGGLLYAFGQTAQIDSYVADAGVVTDAVYPIGTSAQSGLPADLNGDGMVDLLISAGNNLLVLLGRDGGYEAPVASVVSRGPTHIFPAFEGLMRADLNGDGVPDAVAIRTPLNDPYSFKKGSYLQEFGTLQTFCGDGGAVR